MNNLQKKMIEELKWTIRYQRDAIRRHLAHLPELPEWISDVAFVSQTMGCYPSIEVPYSRQFMTDVRKWAEGLGWTFVEEQSRNEAQAGADWPSMLFELASIGDKYDHPRMIFRFSTLRPGAACKRVQIGTTTEEKPIYDYVCDDAGAAA